MKSGDRRSRRLERPMTNPGPRVSHFVAFYHWSGSERCGCRSVPAELSGRRDAFSRGSLASGVAVLDAFFVFAILKCDIFETGVALFFYHSHKMGVGLSRVLSRNKKRAKSNVSNASVCFCCLPLFRGADVSPEEPGAVQVLDDKDSRREGSPSGLDRIRGTLIDCFII